MGRFKIQKSDTTR